MAVTEKPSIARLANDPVDSCSLDHSKRAKLTPRETNETPFYPSVANPEPYTRVTVSGCLRGQSAPQEAQNRNLFRLQGIRIRRPLARSGLDRLDSGALQI